MYPHDHNPPHFHAVYAEFEAQIKIETREIMNGELPKKPLKLVQAWAEIHKEELYESWEEAVSDYPNFGKIDPLK